MDRFFPGWERLAYGTTPVYVSTFSANWFVPNDPGDELLRQLSEETCGNGTAEHLAFLSRLPDNPPSAYAGRSASLDLEHIRELWFHITNRCNMACTHCLFSSSPSTPGEIGPSTVLDLAAEARETGCRLFALTGGEPLVHPEINTIVRGLLDLKDSHVVLLTNGLLAERLVKDFPRELDRLHLQISLDGDRETHDSLRGKGAFDRLTANLRRLRSENVPCTLSMCVTRDNMPDMQNVVDFAASCGVTNVHFMWYFVRGRADERQCPTPEELFDSLRPTVERAERQGVHIDNIESLKTMIFAPPGTIHDGGTAGWESLAVGPDGLLYPSAALVGMASLATPVRRGLLDAWRKSPVLDAVRNTTVNDHPSPMRYLLGGGDLDHSYTGNGRFSGSDPYLPLYEKTALWLISRSAPDIAETGKPAVRLQMGEILESCGAHGSVALVHSNCLLATATNDSLTSIGEFYSSAAGDRNEQILNPVGYDSALVGHIPEQYRFRGYGCGSPVMDADIREGEAVVDLGCGSGVECFIAARLAGKTGSVTGIDMLDPMLELARKASEGVRTSLGYNNTKFTKGVLEALPLENESTDVVLSNCVMNLSLDKRRSYREILRILKPGGRMVISDVVCQTEPDAAIRNDETLRGECIAGALTETHLLGLLEETGFEGIRLIKRFPYRDVRGHRFFSLTYTAAKPQRKETVGAMYRGPLPWILTSAGTLLPRGRAVTVDRAEADLLGEALFLLDEDGRVTNIEAENCCSCALPPEEKSEPAGPAVKTVSGEEHETGCMVCGAPLVYEERETSHTCNYCGKEYAALAACSKGHFVCDACHAADAVEVIRHLCLTTPETDMLRLFEHIRSHPAIKMHGPEYHAMVPGIILATWRNLGGNVIDMNIESGINRGATIAGGSCGFMGICGAAAGAGAAFSIMLKANPLRPEERKSAQQVTAEILKKIAGLKAARCCQRDCWIALVQSAELSKGLLDVPLRAEHAITCSQHELNRECLGKGCPIF